MKCPVCRAIYRPASGNQPPEDECTGNSSAHSQVCRRCGVELTPLIHLHDRAIWYHRQAVQAFKLGDYPTASAWNDQALAIEFNNADFQALAGQLWALQGELQRAITAWKKAQQLNPQHQTAEACLRVLGMI